MTLALFGLHFKPEWDLTAAGTLALALVTLISLGFAAWSLIQTQREIKLSRREVEEAHRPVIVPVADERLISVGVGASSRQHAAIPQVLKNNALTLPLENIGAGPALDVKVSVTRSEAQQFPQGPAKLAGMAKDFLAVMQVDAPGWQRQWDFHVRVLYRDVAETPWFTTAQWNAVDRRYENVRIGRDEEGGRPG
jgi:hypothetical protein